MFFRSCSHFLLLIVSVCGEKQKCYYGGRFYKDKEEITTENGFILQCLAGKYGWETKGIACFNDEIKHLEVGHSVYHKGYKYNCQDKDGELTLELEAQ